MCKKKEFCNKNKTIIKTNQNGKINKTQINALVSDSILIVSLEKKKRRRDVVCKRRWMEHKMKVGRQDFADICKIFFYYFLLVLLALWISIIITRYIEQTVNDDQNDQDDSPSWFLYHFASNVAEPTRSQHNATHK